MNLTMASQFMDLCKKYKSLRNEFDMIALRVHPKVDEAPKKKRGRPAKLKAE